MKSKVTMEFLTLTPKGGSKKDSEIIGVNAARQVFITTGNNKALNSVLFFSALYDGVPFAKCGSRILLPLEWVVKEARDVKAKDKEAFIETLKQKKVLIEFIAELEAEGFFIEPNITGSANKTNQVTYAKI